MTGNVFMAGSVAVVTGAALGIGRAASHRFASLGMRVAMIDLASGISTTPGRLSAMRRATRKTSWRSVLMCPTWLQWQS